LHDVSALHAKARAGINPAPALPLFSFQLMSEKWVESLEPIFLTVISTVGRNLIGHHDHPEQDFSLRSK
jgi:hypothetical protein